MKSLRNAAICLAALATTATAGASVRSGIEAWQRGDHAAAVAVWRPLAAKGDADAAFNLGQAYRLGKGVPVDLARAQSLFEQAARKGHVDGATTLGILLFQNGNRTGAMRWLRRAADAGDARAMLLFGTALYNGDGIAPDRITAYAYVSRAAAQGLGPAKATLADLDEAMPIEERKKGVALAQTMVGKPGAVAAKVAKAEPDPRPAAVSTPPATGGAWRIQLGAFGSRGAAQGLFARLGPRVAPASAFYIPVGAMTRLQAGPFASRADASAACARLKPQPCFVVSAK